MPPTILLARGVRFRQVFVDQRFGLLHEACADGSSSAARMVSHYATSRPRILMSLSSARAEPIAGRVVIQLLLEPFDVFATAADAGERDAYSLIGQPCLWF